jgi:hypothetical protein
MRKILLALVTLAFAASFAAPSFADILTAKNKQECQQAGGVWLSSQHKCAAKKQ